MDSTKNYLEAIREIAKEASPKNSEINLNESVDGLILSIDFQMSIVSSGEEGTQTKHDTTKSLKEEVVTLTSRVATDLFNFCEKLDLKSIYIGCKHDVITENSKGVRGTEEMVLYKVKIEKKGNTTLSDNPFLDTYSITSNLAIEEDHFDDVSIIKERK